jgi:hypothetical protein
MGLWNCEGIKGVLSDIAQAEFQRHDVWIFTETFATEDFQIQGFYPFHSYAIKIPGPGRPMGGVSILVAPTVGDCIVVKSARDLLVIRTPSFQLIAMYCSTARGIDTLGDMLLDALAVVDLTKPVILAGDFNCRIDSAVPTDRTMALLTLLQDTGLWITNDPGIETFRAHTGSSAIDLFIVNMEATRISEVSRIKVGSIAAFRNHHPMQCYIELSRTIEVTRKPARLSKQLSSTDLERTTLSLWRLMREQVQDVTTLATALQVCIQDSVVPIQTVTRAAKPWFNRECFNARHITLQALNLCRAREYMSPLYLRYKKDFKDVMRRCRLEHAIREEERSIREAEREPYTFGRVKSGVKIACPIASTILVEHFRALAQGEHTVPSEAPIVHMALGEEESRLAEGMTAPITVEEVAEGVMKLKRNKAEGIDRIRNEHLKDASVLWPFLAFLFSVCLSNGCIPEIWKTCLLSIIPKGKGDPCAPTSWRGISMKCALGKLFSSLLARRLIGFLCSAAAIPDEQHGFVRGRSTETAFAALKMHIKQKMDRPKGSAYATFIDFRAAFDTASREVIVNKMARLGVPRMFLTLLISILGENLIFLNDGLRLHSPFNQTTGLPQGDTFSSILFVVLLHDLPAFLKERFPGIDIVMYADDIVIIADSIAQLTGATEALTKFCEECGLKINAEKTKAMKFRRGGRLASSDILHLAGSQIDFVPYFVYLGFTLTVTLNSFTKHLETRRFNAIRSMYLLPDIRMISILTGLKLFSLKIAPIASYGVRQIWLSLTLANLTSIENVRTSYLKRLLGISKFSRNRIVHVLIGGKTFVEEIADLYQLERTDAMLEFLWGAQQKMENIDLNVFRTPAMLRDDWRGPLAQNRHLYCRAAAHGFHHRFCMTSQWHEATEQCRCRLCGTHCAQYHFLDCQRSCYHTLEQLGADADDSAS